MARVFLSTLGTNKYLPCRYEIDGWTSAPTPFVQEALIEHFCRDWTSDDRILIFCTEEARKKNWEDGENFPAGLGRRIRDLPLAARCERVAVPEGRNEKEIMEIFMTLMDSLRPEDQVLLDITHSFRSLPLLNAVVLNYAKVLKGIGVIGIHYGAFETLGPPDQAKEIPEQERIAPVFDLSPYDTLLDWARAVDMFETAGRAEALSRLVNRGVGPLLADKKNRNQVAMDLAQLGRSLDSFSLNLSAVRGREIEKIRGLGDLVDALERQDILPPLSPLLERIREKTKAFDAEDPEDKGFAAVRWCLAHDLVPQAYILMRETILSGLCRLEGHDPLDEDLREGFWNGLLKVVAEGKGEEEWKGALAERREEARVLIRDHGPELKELARVYEALRPRRNDFMHGGFKKQAASAKSLVDYLPGGLEALERAWQAYREARLSRKR
ncbi:CRISPR-associated protein, TM1812 family [Desulfacinum infernum DSM 9756]|uniref:CRISPR-associated protein, TM1812 family n=1 Tax=Desulfacinum infernum DSM 9756 TaxID=1121391 RepID=A0A1M5AVZ9_9BACT|nr:TIGR02221 family CRISPR-associated protein [Desulfacinum infernum]SHF34409.1 CRISPR-associated protein, TM1812 family [Desulfacinum infernum DSM 9756]